MQPANRIKIVQLLPNALRSQAAKLLYESFYIKMKVLIKEKDKALRLIQAATNYTSGFYVILDNKLVGIAGIQSKGNKYFNVNLTDYHLRLSIQIKLQKDCMKELAFALIKLLNMVLLHVQLDLRQ